MDFLGDAATYAISLALLGLTLKWRALAALLKGTAMVIFGFWVIGAAGFYALTGQTPSAPLMSSIGLAVLAANLTSALVLFQFRTGDSNRRSVWLCTRNDAISNVAVIVAGGAVFTTNTGWPDALVGVTMGGLALYSAHQIIAQARHELTMVSAAPI